MKDGGEIKQATSKLRAWCDGCTVQFRPVPDQFSGVTFYRRRHCCTICRYCTVLTVGTLVALC